MSRAENGTMWAKNRVSGEWESEKMEHEQNVEQEQNGERGITEK